MGIFSHKKGIISQADLNQLFINFPAGTCMLILFKSRAHFFEGRGETDGSK